VLSGRLSFDRFEVDLRRRRLTRSGRPIRLEPQPFTLLAILLSRAGETVPRAELHKALWPADTHVAYETGLNTAVRKLRRALGESAEDPRVIQTVPGVGYRVIATVVPIPQPPGHEAPASGHRPLTPATAPLAVSRPSGRQVALLAIVLTSILTAPSLSAPAGGFRNWRSHAALAQQALTANDPRGATVEFARAVAAGADDDALFVEYACALARQRQPALALEVIERGLARLPHSVTLRAYRGLYLHAVGRYHEELAALTDAVALDPGSAEAQFHLGLGFARRRDYGASLVALQRAVDLSGGAPRFLSWLGRIAADAGRRDQAEAVLRSLERQAITRPVPEDLINAVAFHLSAATRS
jgi:DNA-binding winged helix-turn-helix (wHTH) protein/Tfp pilus assembly protein PilF